MTLRIKNGLFEVGQKAPAVSASLFLLRPHTSLLLTSGTSSAETCHTGLRSKCPPTSFSESSTTHQISADHAIPKANLSWPSVIYFALNSYSTTVLFFRALNSIWNNEFISVIIWLMSVFLLDYNFHDGGECGSFCSPLRTWDMGERPACNSSS